MGENLFQNLSVVNIEEYFSLDNSRAEFAGVGWDGGRRAAGETVVVHREPAATPQIW